MFEGQQMRTTKEATFIEIAEARINDAVLELMKDYGSAREHAEAAVKAAAEKL